MGGQTAGNEKHIYCGLFAHVGRVNHTVRGAMSCTRAAPCAVWAGWTTRTPFWIPITWSGSGYHDLFQAGRALAAVGTMTLLDTPRPCGLLYRGRADATGAGLRNFGDQRYRRCPGAHPDAVAAAGALRCSGFYLCEQDGPGRGEARSLAGGSEAILGRCLCGLATPHWAEEAAVCDEAVLERYLETGEVSDRDVAALVAERSSSSAFFGSLSRWRGWTLFWRA